MLLARVVLITYIRGYIDFFLVCKLARIAVNLGSWYATIRRAMITYASVTRYALLLVCCNTLITLSGLENTNLQMGQC